MLKLRAGIDITHVPFTGGPPAVQALMTGTVQLVTNAVPTSESLARQGTIRALAVSGEKRWPSLPDVPTLVESGYPGFVTDTFAGLFAPAGTPKDIVDKLAKAVAGGHGEARRDREGAPRGLPGHRRRTGRAARRASSARSRSTATSSPGRGSSRR